LFTDDSSRSAQKVDRPALELPVTFLVSLVTVPGLTAIIGVPVLLHELQRLSAYGEELFRGHQLPLLPFPD
jgi:hypothetical protein